MLAAREGKTASVKELLDGGADKARNLKERAMEQSGVAIRFVGLPRQRGPRPWATLH